MAKRPKEDDPNQQLLDFVPERLELDDGSAPKGQGRLLVSLALGLAAVIATVVTAWYIFANQGPVAAPGGAVPTVTADPSPIKSKPAEPGGIEVPNQDKLVYDRMAPGGTPPKQERLLPPPEQPKPPPSSRQPPSLATPKASVESLARVEEPPLAAPQSPPKVTVESPVAAPTPAPAQVAAAPAETAKPVVKPAEEAKKPAETAKPKPAETAAVAPSPVRAGGWMIQLGAMREQDAAEKEWNRLQAANKDLLGALVHDVLRADLGAKGVFWRVRAGPLDEAGARTLCEELGKRKIGCLVVRK